MRLIFLGPPGAGKGTQSAVIGRHFGIPTVATGNILRAAIEAETPLGLAVKDLIGRGELVPDETIVDMVRERLQEPDCAGGYILDGVPRTLAQAQALEEMGIVFDHCLYFEISDQAVLDRLSGRRTCRSCGSIFHKTTSPPRQAGVCDHCGGELYTRHDDEPATILHRLEVFRAQTAPLRDFYAARGKLRTILCEGTPEEVSRTVMDAVKETTVSGS